MRKFLNWVLVATTILLFTQTYMLAQPINSYNLGDAIADFQLKGVDGQTISLANYQGQKGLIVVFTSNHCPFSKAYEDRIIALDRKFSPKGFPVLAIMPNDTAAYDDDSFTSMKTRARDKHYPYPYTIDETQTTTRAFGAARTPQVYVLKQTNGQFILEYTGAIDDSPQDETGVQRQYVDEAVSSLLMGRPVQSPLTKPIGCGIKWKKNKDREK